MKTKKGKIASKTTAKKERHPRDRKGMCLKRLVRVDEILATLPMPGEARDALVSGMRLAWTGLYEKVEEMQPEAFFAKRGANPKREITRGNLVSIRDKYAERYPLIKGSSLKITDVIRNEKMAIHVEVKRPDGRLQIIPLRHVILSPIQPSDISIGGRAETMFSAPCPMS